MIDGRYQSFVIEHADRRHALFPGDGARRRRRRSPPNMTARAMRFIGASSTDEASSRVQMMVSLLRAMEREDALPLIVEALASPQFYTRWHVMREMLAMDAEAALPSLRRMAAGDPHPEVRAAAAADARDVLRGRGATRSARRRSHAAPDRRRDRGEDRARRAGRAARDRRLRQPGRGQFRLLGHRSSRSSPTTATSSPT